MRKKYWSPILTAIMLSACASTIPLQSPPEVINTETPPALTATLRSASFVTNDLEKSAAFYIKYLGYRELGRSEVTAEKSRQVVGASGTSSVGYISLVPATWSKDFPENAGISFVGMPDALPSPFDQNSARSSRAGELILAHRVTNIDEIERRMRQDGVPFVVPLGLSGSGKSQSMAVLDPNGIRVEMYEY